MAATTHSLLYILLAATLGSPVQAQTRQPPVGIDGCAILASVVYAAVIEARPGYPAGPGGEPFYSARNEAAVCSQTAHSVTSAFTSALRKINIHVTWGLHAGSGSDHCPGHFLSRCYPMGDPTMPPLSRRDESFVAWSWQAIYDSIATRMSPYHLSDVSRFRGDELARSIRRTVAESQSVPDRYRRAQ